MLSHWNIFGREASVYKCNRCMSHVGTRYHCTLCYDFDLCISCFKNVNHIHAMERRDVHLYESLFFRSSILRYYLNRANDRKSRRFIKSINSLFEHSARCNGCNFLDCQYVKKVLHHGRLCKFKNNSKCPIYKKCIEILKCHCAVYCTNVNINHCPSVHF